MRFNSALEDEDALLAGAASKKRSKSKGKALVGKVGVPGLLKGASSSSAAASAGPAMSADERARLAEQKKKARYCAFDSNE